MQALREHPRCGVISGKRGAQWQEMRSSHRSTKDLSSAPELQGVPGSVEAPKPSACLCRDTLRGIAAATRQEGVPMCQQPQRACPVFALDASQKGSAAGDRGNEGP